MIPASCVDNFYEDPDSVRDFALNLDYHSPRKGANFPGERTDCLSLIDKDFYNFSIRRLLSCFFDIDSSTTWKANTYFQKIYTFNSDRHHSMNGGWAHNDDDVPFKTWAAVVYLNKNTCPDSGTQILSLKKGYENYEPSHEDTLIRRGLYQKHLFSNKDVDQNLYSKRIQKHNSKFNTTIEFKNVYNRLIAYDGAIWHKQPSFWVPEKFRLTQVFFIEFVKKNYFKMPYNKLQYS